MPRAELVFANVVDRRSYEQDGDGSVPVIYTISVPGRPLPFVVTRFWKAPQGFVRESFEFVAPSGKIAYRSEPQVRRMPGQMDLTQIVDIVEDAKLDELGIYAASFLVDGEIEGQVEFQLLLQGATALPPEIEDAVKKSDVIWVGLEQNGRDRAIPAWFLYHQGRIYLVHAEDRDAGEQEIPGLPDSTELVVVTRRKGRDTRADRFHAVVRLIEPDNPEFDQLAPLLADRRRDRHGPPQEAIKRWKSGCLIAELTPSVA